MLAKFMSFLNLMRDLCSALLVLVGINAMVGTALICGFIILMGPTSILRVLAQ